MNARLSKIALAALLAVSANRSEPGTAQDYPARPVRIITNSAPGSAVDVVLRIIAERLSQIWGQQVLAVNQPGGGGAIAARAAAAAAPDGYTLFNPGAVGVRGAARNRRQPPDRGAARFRADRLYGRIAHVHLGRSRSA